MPQRRSITAHTAALLGLLSLAGVLCFHFPGLLTSREFRAIYTEAFARQLLAFGLVASVLLGTMAVLRGRNRRVALVGLCASGLAVLGGGAAVPLGDIAPTPYGLGLDWFVVSLFFSALLFVPLEHWLGRKPLSPLRPEWRTDLAYYFVGHLLVQFVLIAVTSSTTVLGALVAMPRLAAWIQGFPVWVQFPLAVLVADLAQASLHRAYHRVGLLWRFHAVHHSSRELDWLAGSRMHLVEILLTRSVVLLPLLVLGFSSATLNAYVILVGLQAVLAHANLGIRFGWLEQVLVLPRYHHWHHARHPDFLDCNYAIHLPLVDRLMGTFRLPRDPAAWPEEYGVMEPGSVPEGIVRQHVAPFLPTRRVGAGQ